MKSYKFLALLFLITIFGFGIGLKISTAFYNLSFITANIFFKSGYWQIFETQIKLKKNQVLFSNKELIIKDEQIETKTDSQQINYQRYDLKNAVDAFYISFEYKFINNNFLEKNGNNPDLFVKLNGKIIRQISKNQKNTENFDRVFIPIYIENTNTNLSTQNLEFVSKDSFELQEVTTTKWLIGDGDSIVFYTKNKAIEILDNQNKVLETLELKSQQNQSLLSENIFEYHLKQESDFYYRAINPTNIKSEISQISLEYTNKNVDTEAKKFDGYEIYFRNISIDNDPKNLSEFTINFTNLADDVIDVRAEIDTEEKQLEKINHLKDNVVLPTKYSKNDKQFFSFWLPKMESRMIKIKVTLHTESQKNPVYFFDVVAD